MAGPLSLDQIARAVENGPRMSSMASDTAALRRMVQDNNPSVEGGGAGTGVLVNQQPFARLHVQYRHSDGKERRVPPSWSMPKISLLGMYQYWHFGDAANNIPPMKYFQSTDVDFLGKTMKIRLCELKKIMTSIDNEAASKGYPPREHMDTRQAATCYHHGEGVVIAAISAKTPSGRDRCVSKMKWTTVIKYMYKKRVRAT